jgi:hypothetical protein
MFLIPLLAIQQPQLPDLKQKVTLDMRAVPGSALMQELSRKTGVYFEALNAAATDRYLVTVRDVPLKQLMDKLAEAETGIWQQFGDNEFRLVRDLKKIEKEQTNERENSIKRFTKAFEKYRKDLGLTDDFSADKANEVASNLNHLGLPPNGGSDSNSYWQREGDLEQQLPIQRFIKKVMLGFTPEQLADMPARTRIVYAVNPTGMQLPLPADATDAISELDKDQPIWEEAYAKHLAAQAGNIWASMTTRSRGAQIGDAMLAFRKWDDGSDIQVELTLLDARGHILSVSYMNIQQPPDPPRPPSKSTAPTKPTPPPKPETPIPLSEADIEMAMLFKNTDALGTNIRSAVSESIRQVIATPTKVDPLNTFATDIIEGFAVSRKQNVVAVLDDRIPKYLASGVTEKGFDPRQIGNVGWAGAEGLDFGSGFFDMREQRPDRSDKINCNRVSLEDMIAGSIAAGRLTVNLAANFAAPLERFNENYIPDAYIAGLFGQEGANALSKNDPNLLRFYGLLDGTQRNGSRVILAGMTGEAGDLLNKLVFGDENRLAVQLPPPTPEQLSDSMNLQTLAREPTIALGGGVPSRSYLTISSGSDRGIIAHVQYGGNDQGNRLFDMRTLAAVSLDSQYNANGWKVLGMAAADLDTVKFDFTFTNTITMNLQLSSYSTTSQETTSPNELPNDVRGPFLDALSQERKNGRGWRGNRNLNYGPP